MKVDISNIIRINGASLEITFNEAMSELDDKAEGFAFKGPVDFKGRLVNASGLLKLDGCLKVEYAVKCCRCLKDVDGQINVDIKEEFVSREKAEGDVETYTYENNYIVIDKVLIDNIILNLPTRQLCSDDCKGLCAGCGNDLNQTACECKDEGINPQMEILKKFLNN